MKIVSVVGIRKSGKTSTVTALTEAIRRSGRRVGTCKSVFCPTFSIDQKGSNTDRHRAAGAQLVCARAKAETALIYPEALPLSRVAEQFEGFDYLLLEGDYLAPVPRLVAAHHAADALERTNAHTLAYVGRIADRPEEALSLPRWNPLTQADELLAYLDAHLQEVQPGSWLDESLPTPPGSTGFCQCGCEKNAHQQQAKGISVTVNGEPIRLTAEQIALIRSWQGQD